MYISHINAFNKEQTCREHCYNTASKAEAILANVRLGRSGYLAGLLHDMGKFTAEFNAYIHDDVQGNAVRGSVIHSFAGVSYLLRHFHTIEENAELSLDDISAEVLCTAIGSHHGLIDCYDKNGVSAFVRRLTKQPEMDLRAEIAFHYECMPKQQIESIFKEASSEIAEKLQLIAENANDSDVYYYAGVLARLITSALVAADRTDTAEFMSGKNRTVLPPISDIWSECLSSLRERLHCFSTDSPINAARSEFSEVCEDFGNEPCGIYRLDLPTGGGKTLSSMRFALAHAIANNKRRIIYTAPLLSIIEQNAQVIRKAVGDDALVLEHHSNIVNEDQKSNEDVQLTEFLQESWDAPVIITTLVRMLDTFFSGKLSDVRRFSALCDSIIIFDEIQSLPTNMISMFNLTLNFLAKCCNTTVILCSATQPEFAITAHALQISPRTVIDKQILQKHADLFKRTNLVDGGTTRLEKVIGLAEDILHKSHSLLIVCNTKTEASYLFNEASRLAVQRFHLSAGMCGAHRRATLNELTRALNNTAGNIPVLCISTQVIEAGIDISFENVIRISAGLDSIVQAAGRCNRNGEFDAKKNVYIIRLADERLGPLKEIARAQDASNDLLEEYRITPAQFNYDLASDAAVRYYYRRLYSRMANDTMDYPTDGEPTLFSMLSENNVYKSRSKDAGKYFMEQAFKTAGDLFKVFDEETQTIIVPYSEGADIISTLDSPTTALDLEYIRAIIAKAGDYCVNLYQEPFDRLQKLGAIRSICNGNAYALDTKYYSNSTGVLSEKDIKEGRTNCVTQIQ